MDQSNHQITRSSNHQIRMRVIAGSLKGRRLKPPTWEGVRPTSDKLRETLFNILAPRMAGARVLDGYAGTGAVGIEACSRGAGAVTFVERDRRAQSLIAENVANAETPGYRARDLDFVIAPEDRVCEPGPGGQAPDAAALLRNGDPAGAQSASRRTDRRRGRRGAQPDIAARGRLSPQ